MINSILIGFFNLINALVSTLVSPLNLIINTTFPQFNAVLNLVNSFISTAFTYVGWVLDSLFISSELVSFVIAFITFKITISISFHIIKLAIKWYNALKP